MENEFEKGKSYILRKNYTSSVFKVKVVDVTKTTVAMIFENSSSISRYQLSHLDYTIIEELQEEYLHWSL